MIRTKTAILLALLFPIVVLIAFTAYKKSILTYGREITLPISGYDPRNLLSGHYLRYRIEYGVANICFRTPDYRPSYVCLDNKTFSLAEPRGCKLFIRGRCENGQFYAGIETYYIPENKAIELDEQVRFKRASIVISVATNGSAQVKDLLIDGKSWQH